MSLKEAAREIRLEAAAASKESSVLQNLNLYELALDGELGSDVRDALVHTLRVESAKEASIHGTCAGQSIASSLDSLVEESGESGLDENSRKRRLAEMLKKREATDTDGGSASPNPPGAF